MHAQVEFQSRVLTAIKLIIYEFKLHKILKKKKKKGLAKIIKKTKNFHT